MILKGGSEKVRTVSVAARREVPSEALRSALAKARWRLLPLLGLCYLAAYMDRVNISFAATTMNRDLGFSAKMYGLGSGMFFLSYALMEIPSNRLLLRFGPRKWIARIMLSWGLVAAAMALVVGPRSFYFVRLLLGAAEAGFFPGALYYVAQWFPRSKRTGAISLFYVALPISSVVMGAAAGALLRLNGRLGLAGWQWMFLVEALPPVVLAAVVWWCLPESPENVAWLDEHEKAALLGAVAAEEGFPAGGESEAEDIWHALREWRTWKLSLMYFCEVVTAYALVFSLPQLLSETTGLGPERVGYLVAACGVAGAVLLLAVAWFTDRSGKRREVLAVCFAAIAVTAAASGVALDGHGSRWMGTVAIVALTMAYYSIQGPVMQVLTTLARGPSAAIAIAAANMCGLFGGFLGPYWIGWMRSATGGDGWGIGLLAVPALAGAGLALRLLRYDHGKVAGFVEA